MVIIVVVAVAAIPLNPDRSGQRPINDLPRVGFHLLDRQIIDAAGNPSGRSTTSNSPSTR